MRWSLPLKVFIYLFIYFFIHQIAVSNFTENKMHQEVSFVLEETTFDKTKKESICDFFRKWKIELNDLPYVERSCSSLNSEEIWQLYALDRGWKAMHKEKETLEKEIMELETPNKNELLLLLAGTQNYEDMQDLTYYMHQLRHGKKRKRLSESPNAIVEFARHFGFSWTDVSKRLHGETLHSPSNLVSTLQQYCNNLNKYGEFLSGMHSTYSKTQDLISFFPQRQNISWLQHSTVIPGFVIHIEKEQMWWSTREKYPPTSKVKWHFLNARLRNSMVWTFTDFTVHIKRKLSIWN